MPGIRAMPGLQLLAVIQLEEEHRRCHDRTFPAGAGEDGLQVPVHHLGRIPCPEPEHVRTGARIQTRRHDRIFQAAREEFSREFQHGYEAAKHQRFVGTGYFDALTQVIAGGASSVTALAGSTEAEQFAEMKLQVRPQHGPDAACQPILGECPSTIVPEFVPGHEEMLLPSGD